MRKFMVGFELLGSPQRDVTPEEAAARLRAAQRRALPCSSGRRSVAMNRRDFLGIALGCPLGARRVDAARLTRPTRKAP